jgi:cobalt-zinc-cadmium efflux system membrane fusion protein
VMAADGATSATPTPGKDPATCQKHALKVQFASAESLAKAGIQLGKVIERPMAESIAVPAEVGYDRTRFARVVSRVPGAARYAGKELGASVQAGDVLVLVDAAEVGRSKADLLSALAASDVAAANEQRLERSVAGGFRTEVERLHASAQAREAEIRLFNSRQALLNLGLPLPEGTPTPAAVARLGIPDVLRAVPAIRDSASLLPLLAPLAGVVVARDVVAGESVDTGRVLYEIADATQMWVTMDVPPALAARVAVGAKVVFRPDLARDEPAFGHVDWISTAIDEVTRTLKVRATVDNAGGTLRANTFGTAQIVVRPTQKAIAVPNAAVQWEGCCHVVFVRLADTVFQTRKVRIGTRDAACTEILVGVLPGEVVVTAGSHVLTAAILKSNLGAGCCDAR